jgi:hypothetical protein
LLCNLQASGTDAGGSTSGGFGVASTGGGTVSMMGAITVNSGTANVGVACRQLSGDVSVIVQSRFHVIRVGILH